MNVVKVESEPVPGPKLLGRSNIPNDVGPAAANSLVVQDAGSKRNMVPRGDLDGAGAVVRAEARDLKSMSVCWEPIPCDTPDIGTIWEPFGNEPPRHVVVIRLISRFFAGRHPRR